MSGMIIPGDCLEVMRGMDANSVDAIVTDPPYGLEFMGKDWDHGIPGEPFWAEALRVAKPGAHLLAFGGTRTFHRLTCAIEDAGWEIRDCLGWICGSGFPKSHNLKGEHEGWGTALKPAWEPIILARKPLDGTVAANVQKWGTGAVNVDGCRVGTEPSPTYQKHREAKIFTTGSGGQDVAPPTGGRWPANIIHDGSDEVLELFPPKRGDGQVFGKSYGADQPTHKTDSGSAARFFKDCKFSKEELCEIRTSREIVSITTGTAIQDTPLIPPAMGQGAERKTGSLSHTQTARGAENINQTRFIYCPKASRREREAGLEGMEESIFQSGCGGAMPIDDDGKERDRFKVKARNHHPTVKPVALMRYLCRLVTPPNGLILDPFCGSGTTGIAAKAEGFRLIGIDNNEEYCEIARRRLS